jgi:CHAD domain
LLNNVERIVQDPPLHAEASPKTLRKRARRAANKATKRLAQAFDAGEGQEADVRLHSARKATKRARYAAELVRSVIGKRAKKQAQRFEELQDILGEHQDSVITAEVMRTLGAQAGSTAGENGFIYGLLFAASSNAPRARASRPATGYGRTERIRISHRALRRRSRRRHGVRRSRWLLGGWRRCYRAGRAMNWHPPRWRSGNRHTRPDGRCRLPHMC